MDPELLRLLHSAHATICERWETLLRLEPISGPLANPDALTHLIPDSLRQISAALAKTPPATLSFAAAIADRLPPCDCGHNPYRAYFIAGEQALVETVVLIQSKRPLTRHAESDVAQMIRAVRTMARAEIDTFCSLCSYRGTALHCRHANASA